MEVVDTALPAVKRLTPKRFADARGWLSETFSSRRMAELGLPETFVQENQSCSTAAHTLRGLHFQAPPHAQGKLVRVVRGAILDVAVDVRRGSPDYGRWVGEILSAENGAQLWVPAGFLHGFLTLEPETHVIYRLDAPYAPASEGAVRFDDPDLAIAWGVDPARMTVSEKDAAAPAFADLDTPFSYGGQP